MNESILSTNAVSNVSLAPLTWRDTMAFYRLEKSCFPVDGWPLVDCFFSTIIPDVVRLKAVVGEELVGLIIGDMRRSRGYSWIATVAVHQDYRRKGVGTALIQACERLIATPRMRLSVRVSNESAIRLYRHLGYRTSNSWTDYYKGGEDALVMEKELNNER